MGVFLCCIKLVVSRLHRLFLAIIEVLRWWLSGKILSDISQTFEILKDYDWVRFSPLIESFSVFFDVDNLARVDFYKLLSVDLGKYFRDHWSLSLFLCMNLALSVQILLNLLIYEHFNHVEYLGWASLLQVRLNLLWLIDLLRYHDFNHRRWKRGNLYYSRLINLGIVLICRFLPITLCCRPYLWPFSIISLFINSHLLCYFVLNLSLCGVWLLK